MLDKTNGLSYTFKKLRIEKININVKLIDPSSYSESNINVLKNLKCHTIAYKYV